MHFDEKMITQQFVLTQQVKDEGEYKCTTCNDFRTTCSTELLVLVDEASVRSKSAKLIFVEALPGSKARFDVRVTGNTRTASCLI